MKFGRFLGQPHISPVDNRQRNFELLKNFSFYFDTDESIPEEDPAIPYSKYKNNPAIIVPEGFVTDMASIPKFLWWLYPPFGLYGNSAILHDWLYTTEMYCRKICDQVFKRAMIVAMISNERIVKKYPDNFILRFIVKEFEQLYIDIRNIQALIRIHIIYYSVRLFGWLVWRKHNKDMVAVHRAQGKRLGIVQIDVCEDVEVDKSKKV